MTTTEECIQEETSTSIIQRVMAGDKLLSGLRYEKDFSKGVCRLFQENGKMTTSFEWENPGQVSLTHYNDEEQLISAQVWNGDGKTMIQANVKIPKAFVSSCVENAVISVGPFEFTLDKIGHVVRVFYTGAYITVK